MPCHWPSPHLHVRLGALSVSTRIEVHDIVTMSWHDALQARGGVSVLSASTMSCLSVHVLAHMGIGVAKWQSCARRLRPGVLEAPRMALCGDLWHLAQSGPVLGGGGS